MTNRARTRVIETGNDAATRLSAEVSVKTNSALVRHAEKTGRSLQLVLREGIEAYCTLRGPAPMEDKLHVSAAKEDRCNVSVRLPEDLAEKFSAKCLSQGVKKSTAIRWIINDILSKGDQ